MTYELYYKPTCPYCQKVLRCMEENSVELPLVNILEGDNAERLIEIGGKRQVPCLVIDGKPLYESGDIVAYIEENLV